QRKCACGGTPGPSGECEECRKKKHQRKTQDSDFDAKGHSSVPPIVHEVLHAPGQSLDAATRAFMEPRFGHDFSTLPVHTDTKAGECAAEVGAAAYTIGRQVVFAPGRYAPASAEGQALVAHELAHVIQQQTSESGRLIAAPSSAEREAETAAARVLEPTQ